LGKVLKEERRKEERGEGGKGGLTGSHEDSVGEMWDKVQRIRTIVIKNPREGGKLRRSA